MRVKNIQNKILWGSANQTTATSGDLASINRLKHGWDPNNETI